MTEHTPTPWKFDGDWHRIPTIYGANDKMVAYVEKDEKRATPERAANAALIVKAVNSHEALVKALQTANHYCHRGSMPREAVEQIESALRDVVGIAGDTP